MSTTIQQVAAEAGVSRSTANMILTGHEKNYAAKTRSRVIDAAKKLNYRPNISAQSLRNRRSYLIGAVYNHLNDPYLADFTDGFQKAVTRQGCAPIVLIVDDVESELKALQTLSDRRVDGILVNPVPVPDDDRGLAAIRKMQAAKVPVLEIFGRSLSPDIHSANTDPYRAGFDVTKLLVEQGCESPVLYEPVEYGPENTRTIWNWFGCDYCRGYLDAMDEIGLEPNAVFYEWCEVLKNPAKWLAELFDQGRFDGLISLGPDILRAAIFCINQKPDRVPEHFTIAGIAHDLKSQPFCRTKAAINLAIRESATQATDQLFNLIEGKEAQDLLLGPNIKLIPPVQSY